MKKLLPLLALPFAAAIAAPVVYDLPAETAELRPSKLPGYETARDHCLACHSVDYVAIQPPKKGKAFWEAEVTKMINVYKASSISAEDAKLIAEYLSETY